MTASGAKETFRKITADYFNGYTVIFANQSRIVKPEIPLVTILPGNVHRPLTPNQIISEGIQIGHYLSRISFTVDLFTNGTPVEDEDCDTVAYENTAMDEMLAFANYLNSPSGLDVSDRYDVTFLIESDAQDLTGAVNDNNYEYRARLEVLFYFTQDTGTGVGDMGYFDETTVSEET
ncbi:MAG: hypothetical protein LUD12_10235 [Lachnospiraceae bacterium]|nr:hypothetical protein [Lachnospiraceae bacterium]